MKDNMMDKTEKGRARGALAKLTEGDVMKIRNAYASGGILQVELADQFGLKPATINQIICGRGWKRLPLVPHGPRNRNSARGSHQWKAKLTEEEVLSIRSLRAQGVKAKDLALQFGVGPDTIWEIVVRNTWTHI